MVVMVVKVMVAVVPRTVAPQQSDGGGLPRISWYCSNQMVVVVGGGGGDNSGGGGTTNFMVPQQSHIL